MAINVKFTSAELDRLQKRKPKAENQKAEVFQQLTPAQRKVIEDSELAKCSYREDKAKDCIVVWYDGFPLIEVPKSRLNGVTDFRKIPEEVEKILKKGDLNFEVKD